MPEAHRLHVRPQQAQDAEDRGEVRGNEPAAEEQPERDDQGPGVRQVLRAEHNGAGEPAQL